MDSSQDMSNQDTELAGDVMESVGEPREAGEDVENSHADMGGQGASDPLFVQKRLKQQKRAHDREIRDLHAKMAELQSKAAPHQPEQNDQGDNYGSPVDEQIHKAVSYALHHKEMEERKVKEAESAAKVHRNYQDLHKHLDSVSDKYDDFDDVVRGQDAPFSPHMRDAALFLPKSGPGSAGEVLYRLGKNPDELGRISKLHALDQASEMVKLSHALMSGGESKGSSSNSRPLGQIKNNPVVNSHAVTDKTPVSELRKRMKQGWK